MRSSRLMGQAAALAATGLLAACAPVASSKPPAISELGQGKVLAVATAKGETSESQAGRIAVGLLTGPAGMALAAGTEGDLGHSTLYQYDLEMADGSHSTIRSFSIAAVDDCVKMTKIGDKPELVLERLEHASCGSGTSG